MDTKTSRRTNFAIIFFGAMGGLLFGYDTGIIASAIVFIVQDLVVSDVGMSLITSSILIGAAIGAPLSGYLSDRVGRRKVVFCLGLVYALGATMSALSGTQEALIISRFILGIAVGGSSAIVPLYLSEMAPKHIRGAMASFDQLMITVGFLFSSIVGFMLSASGNWRLMFLMAIIPSIIMMFGVVAMPESPKWLIAKGKVDEARKVLLRTRTSEQAEAEIQETLEINALESEGIKEIRKPYMRPILILGISVLCLQQFIGINAIIYYGPTIFVSMGVDEQYAIFLNIGLSTAEVIVTLIAMKFIDKAGRKKLFLIGNFCMGLSLLVLSVVTRSTVDGAATDLVVNLTFLCFCFYIASFCLSWGAGAWVFATEIFPLKARGITTSIAVSALWISNFIVTFSFPLMLNRFGISGSFFVFFIVNIIAFIFVYFKVFETKGKSLEEIEKHFRDMADTKTQQKTAK